MARKRTGEGEHTHLAIKVERYDVSSDRSLNFNLIASRPWRDCQAEPVFVSSTSIEIHGTCIYPAERDGERYEISAGYDTSRRGDAVLTMRDVQKRDKEDLPVYRTRRGVAEPVYVCPNGFAVLDRAREPRSWRCYFRAEQHLVSDWLSLLAHDRPLFIAIHEYKAERKRWVRSISLQTDDPSQD